MWGTDRRAALRARRKLMRSGSARWLIQKLVEGTAVAKEVALRIASIRNGDTRCANL